MRILFLKYKQSLIEFFLFSFFFLLCFQQSFFNNQLLSYDDKQLILPLQSISSLSDFFNFYFKGQNIDFQPIRDLSYLIDLKMITFFPWYTFKITQVLLWAIILINTKKFLNSFDFNRYFVFLIVLFIGISPVSISSIAWVAARKHLLSMFFISFANLILITLDSQKSNTRKSIAILIFYFLSLLSQPISLFYPLFVFFYTYTKKIPLPRFFYALAFLLFAGIGGYNFYYYGQSNWLQLTGGVSKFTEDRNYFHFFLSNGRYFFLGLNPFDFLPVAHTEKSILNYAGFVLLLFCSIFIFYHSRSSKRLLLGLLYFIILLLPVTLFSTNVFCSDTYFLNAQIGLYILILGVLETFKNKKLVLSLMAFLVTITLPISINYSSVFTNDSRLLLFSFEKEPNYFSAAGLVRNYVASNNIDKAKFYLVELLKLKPTYRFNNFLAGLIIFEDRGLSSDEKIKKLHSFSKKTGSTFYFLSRLYSFTNNKNEYYDSLRQLLLNQESLRFEIPLDADRFIRLAKKELDQVKF